MLFVLCFFVSCVRVVVGCCLLLCLIVFVVVLLLFVVSCFRVFVLSHVS